jgi:hypothetical protein
LLNWPAVAEFFELTHALFQHVLECLFPDVVVDVGQKYAIFGPVIGYVGDKYLSFS